MRKGWVLFLAGWLLILGGSWLASAIQTSGGITVKDVRFAGTGGVTMSGLLYTPPGATAARPAPGILAVHGYINSRETQSAFAIEYARRGHVVLALDQSGHGYSGGAAFSNGFGGPDGLTYLRSLPIVDKTRIGLEGHSMGGWTVLAAAAAMPDSYQAVVLVGSSTGAPFAAEGTPAWPRNTALVFSRYDEFSNLMWGVPRAADVGTSAKAKALFGTGETIRPLHPYGDLKAGTGRMLYQPAVTHPGDHISTSAVAASLNWFGPALQGRYLSETDQIWMWKELGTGIALVGFVVLLLGTFALLLELGPFARLKAAPAPAVERRGGRWWASFLTTALVPALTYFPAFILAFLVLQPNGLLRQGITNQVVAWALINAAITLGLGWLSRKRPMPAMTGPWLPAVAIGLAVTLVGYGSLLLVDRLFTVDFRFWVVALKLFSADQARLALVYVLPITAFFLVALRALHGRLSVTGDGPAAQYATSVGALTLGFVLLLAVDYGLLFATGRLPTDFDPLSTVIAIQFVPLLAACAAISTFTWRRTGSSVPGAVICGLVVTWYVVAGTATQVA
jgi:pimeloyl-ACP methyl ester carboxylesterase